MPADGDAMDINEEEEVEDRLEDGGNERAKKDEPPKCPKGKRAKPRRQSGTAAAFQKRSSVRNLPERTTSNHLVERKGRAQDLSDLVGPSKPDRRGSAGHNKKATSAMRAARGVPANRGVSRAASSQQAPRRPDRAVAPTKKGAPPRSSSTHSLKQFRKDRATEVPTLTGADLANLRKAQAADQLDAESVQSDMESTYTMDSINLRKSQIHHEHEEDDLAKKLEESGLAESFDSDSDSTLNSTEVEDFEALGDVEVEEDVQIQIEE